jgi:hypothetical protein
MQVCSDVALGRPVTVDHGEYGVVLPAIHKVVQLVLSNVFGGSPLQENFASLVAMAGAACVFCVAAWRRRPAPDPYTEASPAVHCASS